MKAFATFTCLSAALVPFPAASVSAERPNILFILTDDQAAWTLGAYGNRQAHTPNLDRLADEGMLMENAFTVTPVCTPSRASLLTSRYGTELGVTDFIPYPEHREFTPERAVGLRPGISTFPVVFQQAGYRTGLIGKWHVGHDPENHPNRHGYDEFIGFLHGGTVVQNPVLEANGSERQFEGLTVDVLTDQAIRFLRAQGPGGPPFLLSLHYRSPHGPWRPVAEEDDAPYLNRELELPDSSLPGLQTDRLTQSMRHYLASVSGVDRNVGRLLGVLDELGLADQTVVIYTSDDGYNIGHHGLSGGKGNAGWGIRPLPPELPFIDRNRRPNLFDTSVRVPLIIRWPGVVPSGVRRTEFVTDLDWYPTLLSMAGLAVPEGVVIRGRDFSPLVRNRNIPWENTVYLEYFMRIYAETEMRAIRTSEWKLVVDFRNRARDELYHVREDPGETHNLIHHPSPAIRLEKERLLQKLELHAAGLREAY